MYIYLYINIERSSNILLNKKGSSEQCIKYVFIWEKINIDLWMEHLMKLLMVVSDIGTVRKTVDFHCNVTPIIYVFTFFTSIIFIKSFIWSLATKENLHSSKLAIYFLDYTTGVELQTWHLFYECVFTRPHI